MGCCRKNGKDRETVGRGVRIREERGESLCLYRTVSFSGL